LCRHGPTVEILSETLTRQNRVNLRRRECWKYGGQGCSDSQRAIDGNVQGYARQRTIAVSPVAAMPHKTRFHELAHVALGHTAEGEQQDGELTPRNLRECEAESVAMLCCAALELPGIEYSRGYIQSWWGTGNPISERSAQRIFKAADQILKAGQGGTTPPAGR
jgi:hypothetical protein